MFIGGSINTFAENAVEMKQEGRRIFKFRTVRTSTFCITGEALFGVMRELTGRVIDGGEMDTDFLKIFSGGSVFSKLDDNIAITEPGIIFITFENGDAILLKEG